MSETRSHSYHQTESSSDSSRAVGRVVGSEARSVLLALAAERLPEGAFGVGSVLAIRGDIDLLAEVTSFRLPAPEVDPTTDDILLAEAEICGFIGSDGVAVRGASPAVLGAPVTLFDQQADSAARQLAMQAPVSIGERADATTLEIDGERLLGSRLAIKGDMRTGRSSTLAVTVRGLLREAFPARMIVIDPMGELGQSFGAAAEIVSADGGIVPFWMLSRDEVAHCLEVIGQPLSGAERSALSEVLATEQDGRRSIKLSEIVQRCQKLAGESAVGLSALYAGLGRRFSAAQRDPRLSPFFSSYADNLTAEDVLQNVFRLPYGRPPMAVVQMCAVDPSLRGVVTSVILRLASSVAEAADGTIPVLVFVNDGETATGGFGPAFTTLTSEPGRFFGVGTVWRKDTSAPAEITLWHRSSGLPEVPSLRGFDLRSLAVGHAVLVDQDRPWPELIRVAGLPSRALPRKRSQEQERRGLGRDDLVHTIAENWRGPQLG
ncbi:MAG: DUF87 domain-containing protein [Parvularcula sp.]|jgi:hypothetical protein|nr:DUF87 domain-containing protein [Parvularcula sp.]